MLAPKKLIFLSFISLLAVSCGYNHYMPHHAITISEDGVIKVSRENLNTAQYSVNLDLKDQDPIKEELRKGATATFTSLKTKKTLPVTYTGSQLKAFIEDICKFMGSGEQSFSIKVSKDQKVLREKTYTVNIHHRCS